MDTSHFEYTAEDLISHKLQLAGFLVAKPKFDRDGADLLVFMNIDSGTKFCRIQCKGRSLLNSNSSNNVKVFKSYISDAFVIFLFINDNSDSNANLFCFFANDIEKRWNLIAHKDSSKDFYRLSFSKSTFKNKSKKNNLLNYLFTDKTVEKIKNIIKNSDANKEFNKMLGLIKKQNELIKLQKRKTELEKLINKIEHIDEVIRAKEEKIKIMEEYYKIMETQNKHKDNNKD
jgi:hypothetical protein